MTAASYQIPAHIIERYRRTCREWLDLYIDLPKLLRESTEAMMEKRQTLKESEWHRITTRSNEAVDDHAAAEYALGVVTRLVAGATVKLVDAAPPEAMRLAHVIHNKFKIRSWPVGIRMHPTKKPPVALRLARTLLPTVVIATSYAVNPYLLIVGVPAALFAYKRLCFRMKELAYVAATRTEHQLVEHLDALSRLLGVPREYIRPPLVSLLAAAYKPPIPASPTHRSESAGAYMASATIAGTSAKVDDDNDFQHDSDTRHTLDSFIGINPANGFPMMGNSSIDVCGNVYSTDSSWSSGGYDGGSNAFN
ncbi:MAG TPA: hypothetical protein VJ577_01315 [Burkholderiaceae bacterium]|nr:hypothetical protein [Burkholderiaceae bacterium]